MKILIVDDDKEILKLYSYMFSCAGYEVTIAATETACFEIAEKFLPDIILLDVLLSDKNGINICLKIKSNEKLKSIYVVLISSYRVSSQDRITGLNAGAEIYLARPMDEKELLATINSLAKLKKTEEELHRHKNELEKIVAARTTQLTKANNLLHKSIAELKKGRLIIEESNIFKSNLLNNLNHEFRTPLNGIIGLSRMLLEESTDPKQTDIITGIYSSGKRLAIVLDSIFDLARLESNKFSYISKEINIQSLIAGLSKDKQPKANAKNLYYHVEADSPLFISGDESAVLNMISHIIDNAIKFTEKGGVKIKAEAVNRLGKDLAVISIADTGIGISKKDEPIIFRDFRQTSEGLGRTHEGIGLGLTIAHKIANLMGGQIRCESIPFEGSTFYVEFPLIKKMQKPVTGLADKQIYTAPKTPNKILIVEDNGINVTVIKFFLGTSYDLSSASNDAETLQMIGKDQYSLILMDINLGHGMDGFALTAEIRKLDNYKNIPIIAMTGYDFRNREDFLHEKGFTTYLQKPFEKKILTETIRNCFSR